MKKQEKTTKKMNGNENIHEETKKVLRKLDELKPYLKKKSQRVYSNTREWETVNSDVA